MFCLTLWGTSSRKLYVEGGILRRRVRSSSETASPLRIRLTFPGLSTLTPDPTLKLRPKTREGLGSTLQAQSVPFFSLEPCNPNRVSSTRRGHASTALRANLVHFSDLVLGKTHSSSRESIRGNVLPLIPALKLSKLNVFAS